MFWWPRGCCAASDTWPALDCALLPPGSPAHACSCEMRLFFFLSLPPLPFLLLQLSQEKLPEPPDRAHTRALPGSAAWWGTPTCPPFPTLLPRGCLLPAKSSKRKLLRFPRGSAAIGIGRAPRSRCDPSTLERETLVQWVLLVRCAQVCHPLSAQSQSLKQPELTHHSTNPRVCVVSRGKST